MQGSRQELNLVPLQVTTSLEMLFCGWDAYRNMDLHFKWSTDDVTIVTGAKDPAARKREGGLMQGSSEYF